MKRMDEIAKKIMKMPVIHLAKEETEYFPKPAIYGVDYKVKMEVADNMERKRIDGFEMCEIQDMIRDAIQVTRFANDLSETMFANYEDGHISRRYIIDRAEKIMREITDIITIATDLPNLREEKEE